MLDKWWKKLILEEKKIVYKLTSWQFSSISGELPRATSAWFRRVLIYTFIFKSVALKRSFYWSYLPLKMSYISKIRVSFKNVCQMRNLGSFSYFFACLFIFFFKFSYWNDVSWYNWNSLGKRIVLDVPNSENLRPSGIWTRPQYEHVVGIQRECFNQALYCLYVRLY